MLLLGIFILYFRPFLTLVTVHGEVVCMYHRCFDEGSQCTQTARLYQGCPFLVTEADAPP